MAPSHKEILRRTVDALEASLRRYPDNDKILHQLGLAYAQTGRFDPPAITVYQRAAELFPTDVKVQRALSIGYLVTQSTQLVQDLQTVDEVDMESLNRSIDRLLKMTREFPDSPYVHRALGDMQLIRGEERDAIQHYRCAIALGLSDLDPLCSHFKQVRRLRDLSGHVAVFFAEIYQRINRMEAADQLFLEYLNSKFPERVVLDKYAEFLQRRLDDPNADEETIAKSIRRLTRVSLMKGNIQEALSWARQLSPAQVVKDNRLAKDLARRLIMIEDFRQAFEYLSKIPLDEEAKSLLNEMTMLLEKNGELDTAVYILQYINENDELARQTREVFGKKPRQDELSIEIETDLQMAELHWKNRRWDQAFERYLRVLELGYEDYRTLLEPLDLLLPRVSEISSRQMTFLTGFFAERRDWRRTLNYALRGLQDDPASSTLSRHVIQACERILLENPDDMDVRLLYGDEHLRIGNIERAIQEYRQSAETPEYKMKATRRLALATFKAGDLAGTFAHFQALHVLEQEDLERLYDLALAFGAAAQFREAFEAAKMVKEYDPNFRDVDTRLSDYEAKMNQGSVGFVIDPKMRELIGDHSMGRYKYMAKIGSGGMGVVHKVMDLKTSQVVAMKILREGLSSSGKAIDRFFREARIAATLHHKNIVNILDYNISNNHGQSYIAMEFVDGPSLRDVVEKKFSATVDITMEDVLETLDWVSQLCDALDATHKKGIIHRDIKPDNVLLAPGGMVKITDFGIVHIEEATFTPTGALIGTPRYMSPEQVHGGRIDSRSDIYAVGIILYELLIGSPPFISGDISYQQVNVMPTPPREICQTIPQSVDRIIMKCLEKSAADRYQAALECKQDIDEAYVRLGGDPNRRRLLAITPVAAVPARKEVPAFLAPKSPSPLPPVRQATNQDQIETPAGFLERAVLPETRGADSRVEGPEHGLDSELD